MEARLKRYVRLWGATVGIAVALSAASASAAQAPDFAATIARAKAIMLSSPHEADLLAKEAGRLARLSQSGPQLKRSEAIVLWLQGEAAARLNETRHAVDLLDQAERRAISLDPRSGLQAEILLAKSGALIELGEIAKALPALQRAHTLFTAQRDSRGEAKSLILLALMYDGARDRGAALRYFGQALEAHQADPGLLIAIANGRGMTLMELGQHQKAEQDFIQAYRLASKMHSMGMAAIALGNLANVRLLQGHLADAGQTIVEGAALSKTPDAAFAHPTFLRLAAQSAFQRGDLTRARKLIDERFAGVDLSKTILTERDDHQTAYSIYAALGEDHLALQHLAALKRLDDQATEVARSNSAALAAARFDYTNQELRIAKLKADELQATVAHEREQARMQRTVFVVATLGVTLVIGLLAFGMWTLRRSRDRLRVARDKVARALAVKTEFLAATSHEIRTPLNGILGMTEVMIADRQLDHATRDRLSVVHGAGVTMRALVDDILDVAKIETGKMTIEQAPLDLRRTIDEAGRLWREQAEAKGLSFDVRIDACPGWIIGDSVRLRQIAFNLLSNAVKFTSTGSVGLAVTCAGDRFQVIVTDTGIGIAPEAHDVIFDSFRQADAGTTRQFGGTGLGLSICRSLSRAMGGDVTVQSELGRGARFTLDLPLVAADAPVGSPAAPPILLVVRSPITRAMMKALFEEHGDVVVASDLEEAGSLVRDRPPQRVLIEGDEAMLAQPAAIFAFAQLSGEAPVAVLTPVLSPDLRARLLANGLEAVIERPVGKKVLVERVMNLERMLVRGAA